MALEFNFYNSISRLNFKETAMNNLFLFYAFGGWELIIVFAIILILFGANRLPQLAKGMGESIRNFKSGMAEAEAEDEKKDKAKSV
jgi:sec-independent protein translocase protein TatA